MRSATQYGALHGKRHIITTAIEHYAILHTLQQLEKEGFDITYLDVPENGRITAEMVANAIRSDTCLVSVMLANNEIGTIEPIAEIGAVCRKKGVVFHTDAVQAVGHILVDVEKMSIDMLSLSVHKFHGPKGVGVLYAKKGVPISSIIHSGAQERGRRAGTENLSGIVGMAAVLQECCSHMEQNTAYLTNLRDKLIQGLSQILHSVLNGDCIYRLPGNVHFCFEGIDGESLLIMLDNQGICASAGSACTSGSLDPSHVLSAIGRSTFLARGALRLTLSEDNTAEDVDYLLKVIPETVEKLRKMSPVWTELQEEKRSYEI